MVKAQGNMCKFSINAEYLFTEMTAVQYHPYQILINPEDGNFSRELDAFKISTSNKHLNCEEPLFTLFCMLTLLIRNN